MKHAFALSVLLCGVGCDRSQELQANGGDGTSSGTPDASLASPVPGPPGPPPASPPSLDGGTEAGPKGPVSICVPQASVGQANVLIDGTENPYMGAVSDIAFTSSRVFVLSMPWAFVGAPYGGGAVESYSLSATLPSFAALAIGPANASAPGSRTSQNVRGAELPANGGHIFALRGSTSSASDRAGEIIVDGTDLVFWTRTPALLVHSKLSGGDERVVAEYADVTKRRITALALDATDIWFSTLEQDGFTVSNAILHRTPRAGGVVEDVVSLPITSDQMTPDGILFDGSSVLLPGSVEPPSQFMLKYVKGATSATLSSLTDNATRSSPVALDGAYFYWAESTSGVAGGDCPGMLKRRPTGGGAAETLLTNLDRGVRLRAHDGALYLGTASEPFRKPPTNGQLIEWRP